jgi:hypothetical protein
VAAVFDFVGRRVDEIKEPIHSLLRLSRVTRSRSRHQALVLLHVVNR